MLNQIRFSIAFFLKCIWYIDVCSDNTGVRVFAESGLFGRGSRSAGHEFGTHLESFAAAGHSSEYIVAIHGTKYQARTVPRLGAETTTHGLPVAALQTAHAHG